MSLLVIGGIFREAFSSDANQSRLHLAGSGLYAAIAAARLGAEVTLIAPVGTEDCEAAAALAGEVRIEAHFITTPGASGLFAYERRNGLDLFRGYRPAEAEFAEDDVPELAAGFDQVLLFGHPQWDPCASPRVAVLTTGAHLLFDRQGWLSRTRSSAAAAALPAAERLTLANFGERIDEFGLAAAMNLDMPPSSGFHAAIVKDGRWGAHLLESGGHRELAAFATKIEGDLGSGDVFAGALAAALDRGEDLCGAARAAAAAAAVAIAEPDPLPGADFAAHVAMTLARGDLLPVLAPAARAATPIVIEHPDGPLGHYFAESLLSDLRAEGFATVTTAPINAAGPRLRADAATLPLLGSDGPIGLSEIAAWLASQLSTSSSACQSHPPLRALPQD